MTPYKLHATKIDNSWEIPIESFDKVGRRGPSRTVRTFEGVTTEPGTIFPPDVYVRSDEAAKFSHLIGESHVRFRVEDFNGTIHMDFLGFVERVRGDLITLKSHSVW